MAVLSMPNRKGDFICRLAHIRARADLRNCEQFVKIIPQNYEPFISKLLPVKELFLIYLLKL